MTIEIPLDRLADVPWWAWLIGYVLACYTLLGPLAARWVRHESDGDDCLAVLVYVYSPLSVPIAVVVALFKYTVWLIARRIIYGGDRDN